MADQTRIDWCDATIQPFGWGCYGPGGTAEKPQVCWYCYARRLAQRKLRSCPDCQAFRPHWHPEELDKPLHWKRPRRIFVQSMGDPFGDWVTQEQFNAVIEMIVETPRHTYYMLTKQPQNVMERLLFAPLGVGETLPNLWIGASVDTQERALTDDVQAMWSVHDAGWNTFASIEPMLTPIDPSDLAWADWLIVGALTGPLARTYVPVKESVDVLLNYGEFWDVPVFLKSSITKLWPDLDRREWPEEMR